MGKEDGRGIGETPKREVELENRVVSLLAINAEAEKLVLELLAKIQSLKVQCGGLKRQLKNQRKTFENAITTVKEAERQTQDLKAQNRAMRSVIRGIGFANHDRIDDPLSFGYGSVRDSETASVASTAPLASTATEKKE